MAPEVTPDDVRRAQFRTTLRGFDRDEVKTMLDAVAVRMDELEAERVELVAQIQDRPGNDLESEFDSVGREVSAILQTAREAAESMRERATLDAAKWRSDALEETDQARREAAADAEAMRRDAWVTGSQILEQAGATAEAMRAAAERDVLTIMGEAEREAHRLTSSARRESEDMMRTAAMEAEKITADAASRRDEIIDGANRQAATAQERARALEQRRDELLDELENVRSTLTRLEHSLDERREALDKTTSEPSSVKVVHPPADAKKQWELGETVRVVPSGKRNMPGQDQSIADEVTEDVARLREPVALVDEEPPAPDRDAPPPHPSREPEPQPAGETEPEPRAAPAAEPEPEAETAARDDLEPLFASLRRGRGDAGEDEGEHETSGEPDEAEEGVDWIAVREEMLLPITNRALRGVRKSITEIQNVALDSLRKTEKWGPDEKAIAELVHAELVAVWSESFAAGHAVAEQMTGANLTRPKTPASKADKKFASDLASSIMTALDKAGEGQRERQSASSRVFRVWRSDEAERRIRDIALSGYETGIEESRKVSADV
jgi:DivIVA domain-containing protein